MNSDQKKLSRLGIGSPRLNDYFGAWAIAEDHAAGLIELAGRMNVRLHILRQQAVAEAEQAEDQAAAAANGSGFGDRWGETLMEDGTAVIRMSGTLMKFVSSMTNGTSTVELRRMVRRARASASVLRVMLIVDSPGGTVAGTQELADDVAELAAAKPTHAYVEDLCCSAAMWIGSQASHISASRTALIGSIGAVMAVADYSGYAKKQGIKVHVITSSGAEKFKGAGIPGSKVTAEQVAEWKRTLDGLAEHFLQAVAKGRRLDVKAIRELADGRVHLAADAAKLRLIDSVENLDAAMKRLAARPLPAGASVTGARIEADATSTDTTPDSQQATDAGGSAAGDDSNPAPAAEKESPMKDTNNAAQAAGEPKPATVAELEAACAGASSDFILEQAKKNATLAEAKDAYIQWQGAQIRSRDEEIGKLKAATEQNAAGGKTEGDKSDTKTQPAKTGVEPVKQVAGAENATSEDPAAAFIAMRDELTAKGMSRADAVRKISIERPDLHKAFIEQANRKSA